MQQTKNSGAELVDAITSLGLWAVRVGDTVVPIVSLAPGALDRLQVEWGVRWLDIIDAPLERPAVAEAILVEAHDKCGVPAPEPFTDFRELARCFVQVKDDLPVPDPFLDDGGVDVNPTLATSTRG